MKKISKIIEIKNGLLKNLDKRRNNKFWKPLINFRDWAGIMKMKMQGNYGNKQVLLKYNAIYFNIPKVAQSSLSRSFNEVSDIKRLRWWNWLSKKKYKNYIKFAFVRNPYDRIVSLYHNKLINPDADDFEAGIFVGMLKYHKFYEGMSFDNFVEAICSIPDKEADSHFRSQSTILSDDSGKIIPDIIGKFENLGKDYDRICNKIRIKRPYKLPHIRKTGKRENDYKKYYNNKTKKLIQKRYKRDLETFGYNF